MLDLLAGAALSPLLWVQGRWVRVRTPVLPEIAGPRHGQAGDGTPLRLLVLGDSAAAGVGAGRFEQSLAGFLVQDLSRDHRLTWRVLAKSGATVTTTLTALAEQAGIAPFDVVVTSLGVNDVTSGATRTGYVAGYQDCIRRLRGVHQARLIVISRMPPVGQFPALPHPLRGVLGLRARKFDRALEAALRYDPDVRFVTQGPMRDTSVMSSDGFHPGPPVYAAWAAQASAFIRAAR
jgi:lysophospholipase L1-like esterase